jgi:hypothetical protein
MFPKITADQIAKWAETSEAPSILPELLRRLIYASGATVRSLAAPVGKNTNVGGYDLRLDARDEADHVPAGESVWEIGVEEDVIKKLNDDYAKRTQDPLGIDLSQTAYIAVTARKFPISRQSKNPNKPHYSSPKSWADSKTGGPWREVRVLDAGALEGWLAEAPAVASWFARQLPEAEAATGVTDALRYLQDWQPGAARGEVALARLLCAGRDEDVARVQRWASQGPSQLPLRAQTWEEAALFVCAALLQLPWDQQHVMLGRALVVTTPEALRHCTQPDAPRALLIAAFPGAERHVRPAMTHHHLLIPLGSGPEAASELPLTDQPAEALASVLVRWFGRGEREANRMVSAAGRSVMGVLRALEAAPAPAWVSAVDAHRLVPALLVGQWNVETARGQHRYRDAEVFTMFPTLGSVDVLWSTVIPVVFGGASPFEEEPGWRGREVVRWSGREDAWRFLTAYIPALEEAWASALDLVFATPDASFELPASERWLAPIRRELAASFSGAIREGLAKGLALYAAAPPVGREEHARRFVEERVRRALNTVDWRRWATLEGVLPTLAELAPATFLGALESVLRAPERLAPLFEAGEGFGHGLIHALELVAWWPEYTRRVVRVLAEPMQIAGAGAAGRVLAGIFNPWMPQTMMGGDARAGLLDQLAVRWPQLVWSMRLGWLRGGRSEMLERHGRPDVFEDVDERATSFQSAEGLARTVAGVLEQAGTDSARWRVLIEQPADFWHAEQPEVFLCALRDRAAVLSQDEAFMWAWRVALNQHHSFARRRTKRGELLPDANRGEALPDATFWDALLGIYRAHEPSEALQRRWLFEHQRLEEPDGDLEDLRAESVRRQHRRDVMLRSLLSSHGLLAVAEFVASLDVSTVKGEELVATSLGLVATNAEIQTILTSLVVPPTRSDAFWLRFFWPLVNRAESAGRLMGWFEEMVATLAALEGARRAAMLPGLVQWLPINEETLGYLDGPGHEELRRLYWSRVSIYVGEDVSTETLIRVGEGVLGAGRWEAFASWLVSVDGRWEVWRAKDEVGFMQLLRDVMEELASGLLRGEGNKEVRWTAKSLHEYVLGHNVDRDWLAMWEFRLFDLVSEAGVTGDGGSSGYAYLELFRRLERDPTFFVQLLSYWTREDEAVEVSEQQRAVAGRARQVFVYWKTRPGRGVALMEWVEQALTLALASGRGEIASSKIGEMLANGGAGADGVWPDEEVRAVLEARADDEVLLRGFLIGISNRHGSSVREYGDGGAREHKLAGAYRGWAEALEWDAPVAAGLLRDAADGFEREAAREDEVARFEELNRQYHASQEGYFSRKQAEVVGLGPLLGELMEAGKIERIYTDVYRIKGVSGENLRGDARVGELLAVWLWAERAGVFCGETALDLHDLCDISPSKVFLLLPKIWEGRRLQVPEHVELVFGEVPPSEQQVWIDGRLPITGVARTLNDCAEQGLEDPRQLTQAIRKARRKGMIRDAEIGPALSYLAVYEQEAS